MESIICDLWVVTTFFFWIESCDNWQFMFGVIDSDYHIIWLQLVLIPIPTIQKPATIFNVYFVIVMRWDSYILNISIKQKRAEETWVNKHKKNYEIYSSRVLMLTLKTVANKAKKSHFHSKLTNQLITADHILYIYILIYII